MFINPEEKERSQNHSKKSSNKPSTSLLKRLGSTRRRSPKNFSKKRTASNTRSRVVGGCSKRLDSVIKNHVEQPLNPKNLIKRSSTTRSKKAPGNGRHSSLYRQTKKSVRLSRVPRGFRAARGRVSNCPANVTGRVCSARSPKTVTAFFHESLNTSPPITQNVSVSRCAKNSKMTWSSYWIAHRTYRRRPSRTWRPVTTSPPSRCRRVRRNPILSKSAGDNSKTPSETGFSTRSTISRRRSTPLLTESRSQK